MIKMQDQVHIIAQNWGGQIALLDTASGYATCQSPLEQEEENDTGQ